jgi:hypothetical protein
VFGVLLVLLLLFVVFDWPDRLFVAYDDPIGGRPHRISRVVGGNGRGGEMGVSE